MITPTYKNMKKNGTTLYVFPSVEENKNFENQNENFRMYLSHYALVKFPRQVGDKLDFENTFNQNSSSIPPSTFKDALVESLRNYVANHEAVIKNSKINQTDFFYDTFELKTPAEKIFWKWCKKLGIIDFEFADDTNDYFGNDTKYDDNGPVGNTDHFREYLLTERKNTIYSVFDVDFTLPINTVPTILPAPNPGKQLVQIILTNSTKLEPGDEILLSISGIDDINNGFSSDQSLLPVVGLASTSTNNDTIIVEIDNNVILQDFGNITDLELYNSYETFLKFICEVNGLNNVKLPNRTYMESHAYISNQHGKIPYALWKIKNDNNYRPNSQWPILPSQIQAEIQGGENINNPILTNPANYPGDIWAHFDTSGFLYRTESGDNIRKSGNYYGVLAANNISPSQQFPDFDGSLTDGLNLNLNINDYAQAVGYTFPIESFNEFGSTAFNNQAPEDFEFNAVLWYYTVEDVSGNNINSATNLYGVEFLNTPENDIDPLKTKIPVINKYVSNGYQDGNSFSFTLDTNLIVEDGTTVPSFDPEKVYTLFGMELYYEALTRITYFNDKLTDLVNINLNLRQDVDQLKGLVFNQETLSSIRNRMNNLENLLNIYSTLQIGDTDSIIARLDTSINPPLVRLHSIDKRYGSINTYHTKQLFTEFINQNGNTEISINEQIIPVGNGKDFLIVVNNNDNSIPPANQPYDPTIFFDHLELTIEEDLKYKQTVDLLILPFTNIEPISPTNLTNFPINDKKLDLYINYNDGVDIIKEKINTFNLPVLVNYDGVDINEETIIGLNYTPNWQVKNVFYSRINTTERLFSIYVNEDLISQSLSNAKPLLDKLSRFYLKNFLIEKEPGVASGVYEDLSFQYEVYAGAFNNPEYIRSYIYNVEIINTGTAYPISSTFVETVTVGAYSIDVECTTNTAGNIINVEILNSSLYTTQNEIDNNTYNITGGNGDAEIRFIVNPITRIDFIIDINQNVDINLLLTNYDNELNITSLPLDQKVNINKYFKTMPILTLLRGYKISITRITEQDLPVSEFNKRYYTKIEML